MKSFAFVLFAAQAVFVQTACAQYFRLSAPLIESNIISPYGGPILAPPCGCNSPIIAPPVLNQIVAPGPCGCGRIAPTLVAPNVGALVQPNSVASSLADTLSLLTVSSLLSETLPLGYPDVLGLAPALPLGCGCGLNNCGCGLNSYGSYFL